MAQCPYCHQSAGLFRKFHSRCREKHQTSITLIPSYFLKILKNDMSTERFGQLLREVAKVSYITAAELKSLCVVGLANLVDDVLQRRLLTAAEGERIRELSLALGLERADIPDIEEKLIKVDILRDLSERNGPERVKVIGPMLIELSHAEAILWTFNRAVCYRSTRVQKAAGTVFDLIAPLDDGKSNYVAAALDKDFVPKCLSDELLNHMNHL